LSVLAQNLLVAITNAEPAPKDNSVSSFLHDLAYTRGMSTQKLPKNADLIINSIISGDSATAAKNCSNGSLMFEKAGFSSTALNENASSIPKIWARVLFSENGTTLLKARFCKSQTFIPFPFATPPSSYVWGYFGIDPNPFGFDNQIHKGFFSPILIELRDLTVAWLNLWNSIGRVIAWPGLHSGFVIFTLIFFGKKLKMDTKLVLVLGSVVLGRTFVLVGAANGPWYRLALPIYFISITLALLISYRIIKHIRIEFNKL
jgi:hypothetical protein